MQRRYNRLRASQGRSMISGQARNSGFALDVFAPPEPRSTAVDEPPGSRSGHALATEVFLGDTARFGNGKALASYVGMIPSEYSSAGRQRLGALSKQGNSFLRFLWGEAAMHDVRKDPNLK